MTSKPGESPWASILIVCHNDGKWLPRCLASIQQQTIFAKIEVIVADNDSKDGSDKLAQELLAGWPAARFLSTGGDTGFCAGTDFAARSATGRYLFVLNPDTWLEPDCIERLYHAVEQAQAGAGGPTVLNYDDNSLQSECPAHFDFSGNLLLPPAGHTAPIPFSAGGFFFICRDLFMRIGGLDEKFFMYSEEQDLAWRIWLSGSSIISVPAAHVHHQGAVGVDSGSAPAKTSNRTSARKRFLANRNRLLVIAKNCQHLLLLMLIPCLALVLVEGVATWLVTREWALARTGSFAALTDLWRLRHHVAEQRRRIARFRRHGDFWMLRFFGFGFGRWAELAKIAKMGFPRFK